MAEEYRRGKLLLKWYFWFIKKLKFTKPLFKYAEENVFKMLLGNKSDLEELQAVPTCHGEEQSVKFNIPFFEVSAKDNTNISKAMYSMAKEILEKKVW